MKKTSFLIAIIIAGFIAGCSTKGNQVLDKTTIFGMQVKTPGSQSIGALVLQIGLVRNEYFSNPAEVSNGVVTVAPFNSTVHANLAAFNQTADESFGTFQLPTNVYYQPIVSMGNPSVPNLTTNK